MRLPVGSPPADCHVDALASVKAGIGHIAIAGRLRQPLGNGG